MIEKYKLNDNIACIDLKSFYASVECKERGLDTYKDLLVVADETRGNGSVVLAASVAAKKNGIKSRCRIGDLPKDKNIIIAKPQMKKYLKASLDVISFYYKFFSADDIYIYSIDEVFIDFTKYLSLYKTTDYKMALAIKRRLLKETNFHVAIGLGPNMIMAKFALDIGAKKQKNGIAKWTYDDLPNTLWKEKKLDNLWGFGKGRIKTLNSHGLYSVIDVVNCSIQDLRMFFGTIIGEEIYLHIRGIDLSKIRDQIYLEKQKSIGQGQTLLETASGEEVETLVREMIQEVSYKLIEVKKVSSSYKLTINFSKRTNVGDLSFTKRIVPPTNDYREISKYMISELKKHNLNVPVKRLYFYAVKLEDNKLKQGNLFNQNQVKVNRLDETVVQIKKKYGKSSIYSGTYKKKGANALNRHKLIGGHNAEVTTTRDH